MGFNRLDLWVLREMDDACKASLSVSFERSWRLGKISDDWRKVNIMPIIKKV